jgi:hypothetical protein
MKAESNETRVERMPQIKFSQFCSQRLNDSPSPLPSPAWRGRIVGRSYETAGDHFGSWSPCKLWRHGGAAMP